MKSRAASKEHKRQKGKRFIKKEEKKMAKIRATFL
jgi:hypothetical protein